MQFIQAIGFLFLSDCWHFQFVFLLSSPFFLESSNVYAELGVLDCTCQVLGEITYPNSATAVSIVTACTKSGGVLCLVLVHNEDPIISEVCLHSVLEYNRRKWPRSILHFSGASDILTIVGYIPSLKDRTVKVHKRGEQRTIARRRDQDVITVVCVCTIWGLGGIDSKCKIGFMPFVWYCWLLATGMRAKTTESTFEAYTPCATGSPLDTNSVGYLNILILANYMGFRSLDVHIEANLFQLHSGVQSLSSLP